MRYYLNILFFLINTLALFAQGEDLQISVYGFEEGLSHRNVFKIQQDGQGFMWMNTINGLNRFDGIQFTNYNKQSNTHFIPKDFVSDFVINDDQELYLSSPNLFFILQQKQSNSTTFDTLSNKHLLNNLFLDSAQNLWYTHFLEKEKITYLEKWTPNGSIKKQCAQLSGTHKSNPIVQQENFIYIGNDHELWQFDITGDFLQKLAIPTLAPITAMSVDSEQTLWILDKTGALFYKKKDTPTIEVFPFFKQKNKKNELQSLLIEDNGDMWIGGASQLWHYNASKKRAVNYDAKIQAITKNNTNYRQIIKDQQGVIWVASDFGAIKLVKSNRLFQAYLSEGSEYCNNGFCSMRGITGDGKNRIFFCYYNSIHVLDTETDIITPLFPDQYFYNLPFDIFYHEEVLYTGNGLSIDLKSMETDTLFPLEQTDKGTIMLDKEGILWFGFGMDLLFYDTKKKEASFDVAPSLKRAIQSDINYIYQGRYDNYIWIATNKNGLIRFDKKSGKTITFNLNSFEALSSNRVLALYEDEAYFLWIATADGLNQLHVPTGHIEVFKVNDGLSNNFINGILPEGDSSIWISTDNGLSRFSVKRKIFTNFFKQDGLSANEFNRISFYQSKDGRLYFGGLNGVNAFYPNDAFSAEKENIQAPILLTDFSLYDGQLDSLIHRTIPADENAAIELHHSDKFFTLEFALADYRQPLQNKYSYMLEGFESDWSKASANTRARYYNIPAGEYRFKVRAAAKGGNWNTRELHIPIIVQEAFYKSWWFLVLCGLALVCIIYGVFRYRLYSIEQHKRELEREVRMRTQELAEEKQKSDNLLLNILPAETANELKEYGKTKAKKFDSITVLFSDFKDFTKIAARLDPEELVDEIDFCFRKFDEIMEVYHLEKIKTIGDAYMCAGGIPSGNQDMAVNVVNAALDIQAFMRSLANQHGHPFFEARIGIHTGSVVAGIVGSKKFAYDIWGDTVNVAARMEKSGTVNEVNISAATHALIKEHFDCNYRGKIEVKNKGMIDMYYVQARKTTL